MARELLWACVMRSFVLVACASLLACGASRADAGVDRAGLTTNVCDAGAWNQAAPLRLDDGSLFVELRATVTGGAAAAAASAQGFEILASSGVACAGAPDAARCAATLKKTLSPVGWTSQRCSGAGCSTATAFFVIERAGVVTVVSDAAALAASLVPVDAESKAALLAAYAVGPAALDCASPQVARNADGSFDVVLAQGGGCSGDRVESRVRVGADGTARAVQTTRTPGDTGCAPSP